MKPSTTSPSAILKHSSLPVSLTFCPKFWHMLRVMLWCLCVCLFLPSLREEGQHQKGVLVTKFLTRLGISTAHSYQDSQPLGARMNSFPSALLSLLRVEIVSSCTISVQSRYFKSCYKNPPTKSCSDESYAFCLIQSTTTTSITSSCYFFIFWSLFSPVLFARKQWHCSHFWKSS